MEKEDGIEGGSESRKNWKGIERVVVDEGEGEKLEELVKKGKGRLINAKRLGRDRTASVGNIMEALYAGKRKKWEVEECGEVEARGRKERILKVSW